MAPWRWQLGQAGPEAQVQARIQASRLRVHTWTSEAVVQGQAKATAITSWPKRRRDKTSLVSILDSVPFTSAVQAPLMSHCPSIDIEWPQAPLPIQTSFCPTLLARGRSGYKGVRDWSFRMAGLSRLFKNTEGGLEGDL